MRSSVASTEYAGRVVAVPRFVRFESPFWFGLAGYESVVLTDAGFSEPDPSVPFIGVVHAGSVLPVAAFDADEEMVSVQLPDPWGSVQDGLPFWPEVIVPVDEQGEPPRIDELSWEKAQVMFPGDFVEGDEDLEDED